MSVPNNSHNAPPSSSTTPANSLPGQTLRPHHTAPTDPHLAYDDFAATMLAIDLLEEQLNEEETLNSLDVFVQEQLDSNFVDYFGDAFFSPPSTPNPETRAQSPIVISDDEEEDLYNVSPQPTRTLHFPPIVRPAAIDAVRTVRFNVEGLRGSHVDHPIVIADDDNNVSSGLSSPLSSPPASTTFLSEDGVFPVRAILRENATQYLVDWENNAVTGERYQPTWERKANVGAESIKEWESKATRSNGKGAARDEEPSVEQNFPNNRNEEEVTVDQTPTETHIEEEAPAEQTSAGAQSREATPESDDELPVGPDASGPAAVRALLTNRPTKYLRALMISKGIPIAEGIQENEVNKYTYAAPEKMTKKRQRELSAPGVPQLRPASTPAAGRSAPALTRAPAPAPAQATVETNKRPKRSTAGILPRRFRRTPSPEPEDSSTELSTRAQRELQKLKTDAEPAMTTGRRQDVETYNFGGRTYEVTGHEPPEWLAGQPVAPVPTNTTTKSAPQPTEAGAEQGSDAEEGAATSSSSSKRRRI